MSDAPYRFDVTHRVSEIVDAHTDLQSGAETDTCLLYTSDAADE